MDEQVKANFGIDFGGVIVKNRKKLKGEDTGLVDSDKGDIAQVGVFEAIRELVSICHGQVWIISKAGPRMQDRTRAWLDQEDFFSRTGLDPDHIEFCLERQDKETLCRRLEISHFVDDHIHIMQILRNTVPQLYLFGDPGDERFCPPWATYVSAWADIPRLLKDSL